MWEGEREPLTTEAGKVAEAAGRAGRGEEGVGQSGANRSAFCSEGFRIRASLESFDGVRISEGLNFWMSGIRILEIQTPGRAGSPRNSIRIPGVKVTNLEGRVRFC